MAKRTNALKSLATRQSFSTPTDYSENHLLKKIECKINDAGTTSILKRLEGPSSEKQWVPNMKCHLTKAAATLEMEDADLDSWLEMQAQVPPAVKLSLLRLIYSHCLDPFLDEVCFSQYEDKNWEATVTVNGWLKIINRCDTFTGLSFCQSAEESDEQVPLWIECTIYRNNRTLPITVREYFSEVKQGTSMWEKMPRRMLRHRAFQQCARIAFGL